MTDPINVINGIEVCLFDLDGCLYDADNGYTDAIHSNILKYMVHADYGKLASITTIQQAHSIWRPIFDKYNLTKRGLRAEGYEIREREYDEFIRQGEELYIKRDEGLRELLSTTLSSTRKYIFSNGPEVSIHKCLRLLGIDQMIDGVYGTDFHNGVCKPERACFDSVLKDIGMTDKTNNVMYFEDSFKNLKAGKEMGMKTVFVNSVTLEREGRKEEELEGVADIVVRDIGREFKGIVEGVGGGK